MWMVSTPTTVSVLQSGQANSVLRMWMNASCSPTLATTEALASIPMEAIHVSVSTAGLGRAVVRTLMTVRQLSVFMVLLAMIVWHPSTVHVLWARQVSFVTWMMPVSVTLAMKMPFVTPTQ